MLGVVGQQCRALLQGALSATIVDPLAQLFQHCQGYERKKAVEFKFTVLYPSHDAVQVPTLL